MTDRAGFLTDRVFAQRRLHGCGPRLATILSVLTLVVPASAGAAQTSVASPFPAVIGNVRALLVDESTVCGSTCARAGTSSAAV